MPELELFVHQAGALTESEVTWLEGRLAKVLEEILQAHPGTALSELEDLEFSLVGDEALAEVHGEFLDDPTTTDVITFPYGEILVSVDTAARRAESFGKGLRGEVFLYLIHGLLHLAGFDDKEEQAAAEMAQEQERVWQLFWEKLS